MQRLSEYLVWLEPYSNLLSNQDLLAAARLFAAVVTMTFSAIAFYMKVKESSLTAPPALARSETSWDVASRFPVFFMPTLWNLPPPFPFIAADLSTRTRGKDGWYTVTELRLWNSGGGVICGSSISQATAANLLIANDVGPYEIGLCIKNDQNMNVRLGRPTHSVDAGRIKIPIYFDYMLPGKGVLISLRHNAPNGSAISITTSSDQAPNPVFGTHHPIRGSVVRFMNRQSYLLLLPISIFSAVMFYTEHMVTGLLGGFFTWLLIAQILLQRKLTVSPDDLVVGHAKVKPF